MRKYVIAAAAALAALIAAPGLASAATGFVTTDLNVRAGPGTQYPVVSVFGGGSQVDVIGCTSGPGWCDVQAAGIRGWVSANYLDLYYNSRRVSAPRYITRVGVPTISFSIGTYWDNHYRGHGFYRDRGRFDRDWRQDRREIRREVRQDRRQDRRELRQERRENRRDLQQDRRENRREIRQLRREDAPRRELREVRRENRQEIRQERRENRREIRRLRRD